ncbi:MAG: MOSC domain-containing protein [Candidatus Sericytochromatia bacterium]|nr:MOSC domain-containing protein [Candidatus Sericytochromatia bacterium]
MRLLGLHLYPVKGCGSLAPEESVVEPQGLQGDRRWMIVTPDGRFLTQREQPSMALIQPTPTADGLLLQTPGQPDLHVSRPKSLADTLTVQVWRSTLTVPRTESAADAWLSAALGRAVSLVYMADPGIRAVNPAFSLPGDRVSFADGYPMLLTTHASLRALNARLDSPVPMNRFRPNLVISGTDAFAEEMWRTVDIGEVTFDAVKPCERCVVTTTDQQTGLRMGSEPLRTLASWRGKDRVHFGMNLIPRSLGTIRLGDTVTVRG